MHSAVAAVDRAVVQHGGVIGGPRTRVPRSMVCFCRERLDAPASRPG